MNYLQSNEKPTNYKGIWNVGEEIEIFGRVINDPRPADEIFAEIPDSEMNKDSFEECKKVSGWWEYEINQTRKEAVNIRVALQNRDEIVEIVCFGDAVALGDGIQFNEETEIWESGYQRVYKGMFVKANGTFELRPFDSKNWGLVWQPQCRILNPIQCKIIERPPRPMRLRGSEKVNKTAKPRRGRGRKKAV